MVGQKALYRISMKIDKKRRDSVLRSCSIPTVTSCLPFNSYSRI